MEAHLFLWLIAPFSARRRGSTGPRQVLSFGFTNFGHCAGVKVFIGINNGKESVQLPRLQHEIAEVKGPRERMFVEL